MANPFSKGWKYLMQSFDTKIDENADPKVQIQQAINAAKEQHQAISQQAANIIGNRNQLQRKMERLIKSQEDLQTKARTALQAAQKAEAAGDAEKAQQFNNAAEVIATYSEGNLRRIAATIIVERRAHKPIVLGQGGERIKRIASEARQGMERMFDGKVFLTLWVQVRSGWAKDAAHLRSYGYE